MVQGLKKEFVTVKRGQDFSEWSGRTVSQVYQDFRSEDGKLHKGPPTSTLFVEDVRGYILPVDASQMQPAEQSDWDASLRAFEKEKAIPKKADWTAVTDAPEIIYSGDGFTNAASQRGR